MRRSMGRRKFLSVTASASAAGLLIACGSDSGDDDDDTDSGGTVTGSSPAAGTTATAATADAVAKRGGRLNVGYRAEPRGGFEPHTGFGGDDHYFNYLTYDQLIAYDRDGILNSDASLAEEWEIVDPTTISLTLRQGITFHDGSPFDAETVKWNLDRILDPETKATPRPDVASIDRVDAPSATEVLIKLKSPDATILYAFGDLAGMMISRKKLEDIGLDAFRRDPSGTGPFILKEWTAAADMLLERNPNYWRKDANGEAFPYLDSVRFQFIPEDTVRTAALESGQINLLSQTPALDASRLSKDNRFGTASFVGATTGVFYINHTFAPLDNVAFRQAFAHALDVPNYVRNFATGAEPLAGSLLTPRSWAYDESVGPYGFDVQKARALLDQSGIAEADRTVIMQIQSQSLSQGEEFWEASLKQAGIKVTWLPGKVGGARLHLFKGQGGDGTAAAVASSWSMRVDPHGTFGQFYTQTGPYNASQAAMPDVEPLVQKARETYEQEERKSTYAEISKIGREKLYAAIPTFYSVFNSHGTKEVKNLENLYGGEGKPRYANLWLD